MPGEHNGCTTNRHLRESKVPLLKPVTPATIRAPFGHYNHAVEATGAQRMLFLSGQLGIRPDESVPESLSEQAELVFANIEAVLKEAGMGRRNVVRLTTFLLDPEDRVDYMRVRDAWVEEPAPASTLLFIKALALPAFRIEIEAIAVA
jgi:enamine deaminase RidA (YjgF/YER057c/UK114 family)